MEIKQHYKNLIIGFGKGGKTLAAYLAKRGEEVALVERSTDMYGGSCINVACIPTKSLITDAQKNISYEDAFKKKNKLISALREKNLAALLNQACATVIDGTASFNSDRSVRIVLPESGNEVTVSAERIFINTGSKPFIPTIDGVKDSKRVFTSTSLMEQSVFPMKLIIIGGGFIGLEFADMYSKFGAHVTVLDQGQIFLPTEDRDVANELHHILTQRKVNIIQGASVRHIQDATDSVIVKYKTTKSEDADVEGAAVLLATGRQPNIEQLNLAAAGIDTNKFGYIAVDDMLQTSAQNIWAIGDINGGPQFTYISLDDFRIIRDQLFGGEYKSLNKRKLVASSVFTSPPLAHIGLREHEAKEKGYSIKVAKLDASSIPRAQILNETQGLLKSVVDSESNKILGCTLLCAEASEMINTIQIAMNAGMDYRAVRDTIFTHPSMTEAFNDLYNTI